ncbi:MAG TPA: hypothetical protein VGK49_11735, partial [Ilumatobacteraceae bacterium]
SSIDAGGNLAVTATADQSIAAIVVSGSIAVAGGGSGAFAASGAGTQATNRIALVVHATIDGDGADGIHADRIRVTATDASSIKADTAAASIAVTVGLIGGSISIAATLAENTIANDVSASIENVAVLEARLGDATTPGIIVHASETASIESLAVAASISASISLGAGFAGAGTSSLNTIASKVNASIDGASGVTSAHGIDIAAGTSASLKATIVAAALGAGLVSAAAAVTVSRNTLQDDTTAGIRSSSSVTATAGNVDVKANSTSTMKTIAVNVAVAVGISAAAVVVTSEEKILSTVTAELSSSTITAAAGIVTVAASALAVADPDVVAVAVGAASVNVINYSSTIGGTTTAKVDGASTRVQATKVDITATDTNTATPDIRQINIGAFTVSTVNATPTINRTTQALIGAGATLIAQTLSTGTRHPVALTATSTSTLDSSIKQFSFGLITIGVLNLGGTISTTTRAYIDKSATVTAAALTLSATSTPKLTSEVSSVQVSALSVGAMSVTGTLGGSTEAYVEENVAISASSLTVSARLNRPADSLSVLTDLFYVGVGLAAAGTDAVSTATITADTRAFIGARGTATLPADPDRVVDVSGDIIVTAVSDESAKAKIEGGEGSLLLAVGILQPEATISGDVEAYAGQNARVEGANVVFSTAP